MTELFSEFSDLELCITTTSSQCLFEAFQRSNLLEKWTLILPLHVQSFEFFFTKKDFNTLSEYYQQDYTIELVPRAKPNFFKVYPLLSAEQSKLNAFLSGNLYTSQICSFKSHMAILVFFTKKKDSSLHLVQNYKSLNIITVKNKYLLFLISKLIIQIQEAKYFTKLDACLLLTMFSSSPEINEKPPFRLIIDFLSLWYN